MRAKVYKTGNSPWEDTFNGLIKSPSAFLFLIEPNVVALYFLCPNMQRSAYFPVPFVTPYTEHFRVVGSLGFELAFLKNRTAEIKDF